MQVNSVNSLNFKGSSEFVLNKEEEQNREEKFINAARTLEGMLPDRYVVKVDENGNEVKTKSAVGTVFSVAGAALISFALCKKFLTKGSAKLEEILANDKVQEKLASLKGFASENISKIGEKIQNSPKLNGVVESIKNTKVAGFAEKAGNAIKDSVKTIDNKKATNILAGIGGVAGAAYVSKTDSNNDGVADIAQKGINAYKGTVERMGVIGEALKALS